MCNFFKNKILVAIFAVITSISNTVLAGTPTVTGTPVTDSPKILNWEFDNGNQTPSLHSESSNILHDFHGSLDSCDIMMSTEGNYHMALKDIWPVFLSKFEEPLMNAFYSTSPPVVVPQITNSVLQFGNLYAKCAPSVAVANKKVISKLTEIGAIEGDPSPLYIDKGQVLLVKRGNPKNIKSVWDLAKNNVNIVTPNFSLENGAFETYSEAIYNIALKDVSPPAGTNANILFNTIFNGKSDNPNKWLQGSRIHHRDVPWSVAYGNADVAVIYYHLGLVAKQSFPDTFDIVPLGGTIENPEPLPGSKIGERYVVSLKGNWNKRQLEAREKLVNTLRGDQFTKILQKRGLQRPKGFVAVKDSMNDSRYSKKNNHDHSNDIVLLNVNKERSVK